MERDSIDFANENVGKLFRQMFIPTLIGMVSLVVLNITDGAFIGHGVGSDALAAVNIAAPIFTFFTGIGLMFGIGASVVASIHLSHGKVKAARINITQALLASLLVAFALGVLIMVFLDDTCRLFGSSEQLVPLAGSYMWWIALLFPLNMLGSVGSFIVRLDGAPKLSMMSTLIASILNIFLDWLFIYPFGWGLEGAAIATSFSFSISGIILFVYMLFFMRTLKFYPLKLTLKSLKLSIRNIGYQMRMGFSAMLGDIAISGVMITGNYIFIDYLGEDGVAAFSVACYCLPVVFMVGNAIVQSSQPIISFAFGIGNEPRIRHALTIALGTAIASGLLGALSLALLSSTIAGVFMSTTCKAYQICTNGLPYFAICFMVVAINLVLVGFYQSIKQAGKATLFTLLRGFILVIPCFILLPKVFGVKGIWLAMPTAEIMTALIIVANIFVRKNLLANSKFHKASPA